MNLPLKYFRDLRASGFSLIDEKCIVINKLYNAFCICDNLPEAMRTLGDNTTVSVFMLFSTYCDYTLSRYNE